MHAEEDMGVCAGAPVENHNPNQLGITTRGQQAKPSRIPRAAARTTTRGTAPLATPLGLLLGLDPSTESLGG